MVADYFETVVEWVAVKKMPAAGVVVLVELPAVIDKQFADFVDFVELQGLSETRAVVVDYWTVVLSVAVVAVRVVVEVD